MLVCFVCMKRTDSTIIAIGGGNSSEDIHDRLFELLKEKPDPRIAVMTVASSGHDDLTRTYNSLFRKRGVRHVAMVNVWERGDSFDKSSVKKIAAADMIYFTGGDQLNVTSLFGGSPLHNALVERVEAGVIVAGTSAGAAMMSFAMIINGQGDTPPSKGCVEIAPGLDLIRNAFIDTHFSQRGRHGRLLTAVAHHPQILGIGIDESTAIEVRQDRFRVLGRGTVTIVDGEGMHHADLVEKESGEPIGMFGVRLHVLPAGYSFDMETRQPEAPAKSDEERSRAANC